LKYKIVSRETFVKIIIFGLFLIIVVIKLIV